MVLHQYDYIFAIGTIFAFLDAWNIGANDVANSWANAVAARSVTYLQAMILASIMEFVGATAVGARVADTIRTKIVDTALYEHDPAMLMLGMTTAVIGSSLFLTLATKLGLPISTTHSILGGVLGMGVATVGADGILWVGKGGGTSKISGGVVQVFMAWIIAPVLAGVLASAIFLLGKYAVLIRKNPAVKGLMLVPVFFSVTGMLITMLLVWKGGSYEVKVPSNAIPGVIVGVGLGFGILVGIFLCPWLYRYIVVEDWQLKWYHMFQGPLVLKRGDVPPPPAGFKGVVRDFYKGRLTKEQLDAKRAAQAAHAAEQQGGNAIQQVTEDDAATEGAEKGLFSAKTKNTGSPDNESTEEFPDAPVHKSLVGPKPEDLSWYDKRMLFWYFKLALFHGIDKDVVSSQSEKTALGGDVEEMHSRAARYDNKAEFLFTFMQVITNCAMAFTHGANDVSNCIGPYSTIYQIWHEGRLPENGKSSVPIWILFFGGVGIVIGLWTYGYNIMRNLGNRLTLQSPSRGFSMSLGSVATVILATRLKLPVSTTQCMTGATVGVGLCNGEWRAVNWRMVAWIYLGWFITLPVTGIISGCLMGIIINAPRWGMREGM
ncbi:hypothetical protein jhhlp_004792 [Lomentospora prolificans]|uniref:Phosphate transporter n=1 Tax=Lomentospora prolificans TaxID=41688 RepID=A0A2N3N8F9_9PEZI|nr:hypothetical protein jhhlp_004792 [Lomentospora prolificans]